MNDSTRFRSYAEEHNRVAQRATSPDEREAYLKIAEAWRSLAATAAELEALRREPSS